MPPTTLFSVVSDKQETKLVSSCVPRRQPSNRQRERSGLSLPPTPPPPPLPSPFCRARGLHGGFCSDVSDGPWPTLASDVASVGKQASTAGDTASSGHHGRARRCNPIRSPGPCHTGEHSACLNANAVVAIHALCSGSSAALSLLKIHTVVLSADIRTRYGAIHLCSHGRAKSPQPTLPRTVWV